MGCRLLGYQIPSKNQGHLRYPWRSHGVRRKQHANPAKPEDRTKANNAYDHWAQSISKYERSNRLSPFTSKFDAFLAGKYTLTPDETAGYNLFNGKANCNSCHLDGRSTALTPGETDTGAAANTRP